MPEMNTIRQLLEEAQILLSDGLITEGEHKTLRHSILSILQTGKIAHRSHEDLSLSSQMSNSCTLDCFS